MSSLINHLGIDRLGPDERLRLVEEIWESLQSEAGWPPLTDAQRRELDRRVAALDADPGSAVAWDEVESRAFTRLRK
jgi:putative addiction module component (TIGR02574 family)